MSYDFLIVGSGLFGCICARELTDLGYKCLVIESRNHIGGNCYTDLKDNIHIHSYGPHIFHTDSKEVWSYINRFTSFSDFKLNVVANYKGDIFSLPFNMWTFSKIYGLTHPLDVEEFIKRNKIDNPQNFVEYSINKVGLHVYEKLIKGYSKKQWGRDPIDIPVETIKRLPVRLTYDNNYFNDKYQGIPSKGYTEIFNNMLCGIEYKLNTDYFTANLPEHNKVIYTGPIDKFFDFKFGKLEYKSLRFEHTKLEKENFQGCAIMNYTDEETPWTRIVEHKHFTKDESPVTWITKEYPTNVSDEKFYPLNDKKNNDIYSKYKEESEKYPNIFFGGRLAEYKYYDMDDTILSALKFIKEKFNYEK